MNLYQRWDEIIAEVPEFYKYAEGKYSELMTLRDSCTTKKLTTYSRRLGIAHPSKLLRVMCSQNACKKGRIIKNIPPNGRYCEFFYDNENKPLCRVRYNGLGSHDTMFWIDCKDAVWTTSFFDSGEIYKMDTFKIITENGRLLGLYEFRAGVCAEEYDYSEEDKGIIWCTYSRYIPELWKSSKDIPAGFPNSPMIWQSKYKVYVDGKGKYIKYDFFKNIEGEFVFGGQFDF